MRTPTLRVVALGAFIALTACSSGTRVIVVRQPAPPPPPPPPRIQPLEITVARPIRGQLLVQTNRPSYVALFEIVPERGVALLAPTYAHQRTWMLAGLNWVPVSWKLQSTMYYGPPSGTAVPGRWVYAIASDVPLRLPDEAFNPTYMRRVLGPTAYRATNPHLTMRAIARAFVPSVIDEAWAEDAYALAATYTSDPYRTVRIYCANRTVYEVPEELADRAWCPVSRPVRAGQSLGRPPCVRIRSWSEPAADTSPSSGDDTGSPADRSRAGAVSSGGRARRHRGRAAKTGRAQGRERRQGRAGKRKGKAGQRIRPHRRSERKGPWYREREARRAAA